MGVGYEEVKRVGDIVVFGRHRNEVDPGDSVTLALE